MPAPAQYQSKFAEAAGLKFHYLDYGTEGRPPMLCVHGGAAHAHWYDFVAPAFTPDFHVRSLDLRGHGDSAWADPPEYMYANYAADLDAFCEKLDLRDFVLMGHSMGGTVCLLYAALHPGRVGKLVIVDTTVNLSPDPQQAFIYVPDGQNGVVQVLARADGKQVGSFGRTGPWAGQFRNPHNITSDSQGNIYVTEAGVGRRIQKFVRD